MASPGSWYRFVARAACLLAILCPPRAAASTGARPTAITVVAAYAVNSTYYHAWLNGQVDTPPPTRSFPSGTAAVAYYVSFREAVPAGASPEGRLYDARGALLGTLNPLFGIVCKRHARMDSFTMKPAFADGSYRIDMRLGGTGLATIGFTIGHATPVATNSAPRAPITAFYATSVAAHHAVEGTDKPPARVTSFPAKTKTVGYYIAADGQIRHLRYQIQVTQQGHGVVFTTDPANLLDSSVRFSGNAPIKGTIYESLDSTPYFPNGIYRFDLLVDGGKAATTTFTIGTP